MVGDNLTWFFEPKPATDDEIADLENAIGNRLPSDFREFAKSYSGGSPNETDFEFPDEETGTFHASASVFLPLSRDADENILKTMQRTDFFPTG